MSDKKDIQPTIRTPQELVHIKHQITIRQYKYWVLMLRKYRELYEAGSVGNSDFIKISKTEIEQFIGYEPVTKELRDDLESIRVQPIIYNILGKDGKKAQRGAGFISEWEVTSNWIGFKLPSFLEESIQQLDLKTAMFHQLNWSIFNSFNGKYEAIIYKLCKDYIGVGRTPYMELLSYREYMGLHVGEYGEFKDLNKYVISGPVKKINSSKFSDIEIEVITTKESRKVVGLYFKVKYKQDSLDFGDNPAFRHTRVHISVQQQKKYLEQVPADEIELAIERANVYADTKEGKGEAVELGAIYHTAITGGWGKELAAKKREDALRAEKQARKAKPKAPPPDKDLEVDTRWREEANAAIEKLSEDDLQKYFSEFKAIKKAEGPLVPKLLANGTKSPIFLAWLRTRLVPKD